MRALLAFRTRFVSIVRRLNIGKKGFALAVGDKNVVATSYRAFVQGSAIARSFGRRTTFVGRCRFIASVKFGN